MEEHVSLQMFSTASPDLYFSGDSTKGEKPWCEAGNFTGTLCSVSALNTRIGAATHADSDSYHLPRPQLLHFSSLPSLSLLTTIPSSWDDWVLQDRLRKFTDDNKELAANLKRDLIQQSQPKSAFKPVQSRSRKQGSEFGSGRGSEERHSSVPAGARGTKRGRDNDIEKVSTPTVHSTRISTLGFILNPLPCFIGRPGYNPENIQAALDFWIPGQSFNRDQRLTNVLCIVRTNSTDLHLYHDATQVPESQLPRSS